MRLARTFETAAEPAQKPARDALSALLALGRPLVMGILNVTPDSFSDGGQFLDPATRHRPCRARWPSKAPTSSTSARNRRGPMAAPRRCRPTRKWRGLRRCCRRSSSSALPVSIDTIKAGVAAWALDQGAAIVNDVWGLQRDPDMARAGRRARRAGHRHAQPRERRPGHRHHGRRRRLLRALARDRRARRHRARQDRARSRHRLRQDAGAEHRLHRAARRIQALRPAAPGRRLAQALHQYGDAVAAGRAARRLDRQPSVAVENGAAIVRAHDVAETVQALRVAAAIEAAR